MFMISRCERPFDVTSGTVDKPMKVLWYSFERWPPGPVVAGLALLHERILAYPIGSEVPNADADLAN